MINVILHDSLTKIVLLISSYTYVQISKVSILSRNLSSVTAFNFASIEVKTTAPWPSMHIMEISRSVSLKSFAESHVSVMSFPNSDLHFLLHRDG